MHYARSRATPNDWFISGDCGAGYLNPGMLAAPRLDPALPAGWEPWVKHNLPYFRRYDLSITGFVIDGHAPPMAAAGLDAYARFSPDGIVGQKIPRQGLHAGVMPYIRMRSDLSGRPDQAGALIAKMAHMADATFLPIRTILKSPTWHKQVIAHALAASGGDQLRFVDPYTFFLLLKTFEQNRASARGAKGAPRVGDSVRFAAPRDARGLSPIAVADGPFQRRRLGGREVIHQAADKTRYLYFDVSRDFADDLPPSANVTITVRVTLLDRRKGTLRLEYDSHDRSAALDGAYTAAGDVTLAGSNRWVTVTFDLPRCRFAGRQNGGAGFRLVNLTGDLAVHGVVVTVKR